MSRVNLCTNPGMGAVTNGKAGFWNYPADGVSTYTYGVADRTVDGMSVKAACIRVVGAGTPATSQSLDNGITGAGSVADGDYLALSIWLKVNELTGCTISMPNYFRNDAGGSVGYNDGSIRNDAFPTEPTDWARYAIVGRCPAKPLTSQSSFKIQTAGDFHADDVYDIEVAMVLFEKLDSVDSWFSGDFHGVWNGTAYASTSTYVPGCPKMTDHYARLRR